MNGAYSIVKIVDTNLTVVTLYGSVWMMFIEKLKYVNRVGAKDAKHLIGDKNENNINFNSYVSSNSMYSYI